MYAAKKERKALAEEDQSHVVGSGTNSDVVAANSQKDQGAAKEEPEDSETVINSAFVQSGLKSCWNSRYYKCMQVDTTHDCSTFYLTPNNDILCKTFMKIEIPNVKVRKPFSKAVRIGWCKNLPYRCIRSGSLVMCGVTLETIDKNWMDIYHRYVRGTSLCHSLINDYPSRYALSESKQSIAQSIHKGCAFTSGTLPGFSVMCEQPWYYAHSDAQAFPMMWSSGVLEHSYRLVSDPMELIEMEIVDDKTGEWIPAQTSDFRDFLEMDSGHVRYDMEAQCVAPAEEIREPLRALYEEGMDYIHSVCIHSPSKMREGSTMQLRMNTYRCCCLFVCGEECNTLYHLNRSSMYSMPSVKNIARYFTEGHLDYWDKSYVCNGNVPIVSNVVLKYGTSNKFSESGEVSTYMTTKCFNPNAEPTTGIHCIGLVHSVDSMYTDPPVNLESLDATLEVHTGENHMPVTFCINHNSDRSRVLQMQSHRGFSVCGSVANEGNLLTREDSDGVSDWVRVRSQSRLSRSMSVVSETMASEHTSNPHADSSASYAAGDSARYSSHAGQMGEEEEVEDVVVATSDPQECTSARSGTQERAYVSTSVDGTTPTVTNEGRPRAIKRANLEEHKLNSVNLKRMCMLHEEADGLTNIGTLTPTPSFVIKCYAYKKSRLYIKELPSGELEINIK